MVDSQIQEFIVKWIERAQVDYSDLYVRLYIAYNAWFRKVTHTSFDREGIARLTKRFVIWDDYEQGKVLIELKPVLAEIADVTAKQPLTTVPKRWDGVVANNMDWKGLIHFWYQVRCDLFHGNTIQGTSEGEHRVKLAYVSLNMYMLEISRRMKDCFTQEDHQRLTELDVLMKVPELSSPDMQKKREFLHQKYIRSHDIWSVDTVRV